MNIEELIQQNTKALIENTAALREILSVGAVAAADTLVPTTPKKRVTGKTTSLTVVEPEPEPVEETPAPVAEETPEPEPTFEQIMADAPTEAPPSPKPDHAGVPDLPVPELRNSLKEVIKGKLLGDTEGQIKQTFDALRAKYGVSVIKELTDDQVSAFYAEVLSWE
jgi:hypothetical protein